METRRVFAAAAGLLVLGLGACNTLEVEATARFEGPGRVVAPETVTAPSVEADSLAITRAASAFLGALAPPRRGSASLPFNSDARLTWDFVPKERPGVSIEEMTPGERQAASALLQATVSVRGFKKVETIRALDQVLFDLTGSPVRNPGHYWFAIFGEPAESGAWGWRIEGHHLSLHWTFASGSLVASTPQFLGANPAEVLSGSSKGTRALAAGTRALPAEEDLARALVTSLSAAQQAEAVVSATAPRDILTGTSRDAAIQEDRGIAYGRLTAEQQGLLISLLQEYASLQTEAVARARMARVKAELPRLKFAWMGGIEKGQGHYYRIQGTTFLIEYDNTQDEANHIHCVWQEFKGDWGRDLLAEHYRTAPHHGGRSRP